MLYRSRMMFSYITILATCLVISMKAQEVDFASALSNERPIREALGSFYTLHTRTPSRRLRFGRRSAPGMEPITPPEELEEIFGLRSARSQPVRLRFGRRSSDEMVPQIFSHEEHERSQRAPSLRLRFGRRSDSNVYVMPYDYKEAKTSTDETDLRTQE